MWYSKIKNKREDYNTLKIVKKVFYILFTIFITVYIIIFAFIKATFKFIKIIVTVLAKGLLGMLGLFYSNNKSIKKKKENKQFTKPQYFSELGDMVLTLISIILGTNNS